VTARTAPAASIGVIALFDGSENETSVSEVDAYQVERGATKLLSKDVVVGYFSKNVDGPLRVEPITLHILDTRNPLEDQRYSHRLILSESESGCAAGRYWRVLRILPIQDLDVSASRDIVSGRLTAIGDLNGCREVSCLIKSRFSPRDRNVGSQLPFGSFFSASYEANGSTPQHQRNYREQPFAGLTNQSLI
jgi:hypothetical protein